MNPHLAPLSDCQNLLRYGSETKSRNPELLVSSRPGRRLPAPEKGHSFPYTLGSVSTALLPNLDLSTGDNSGFRITEAQVVTDSAPQSAHLQEEDRQTDPQPKCPPHGPTQAPAPPAPSSSLPGRTWYSAASRVPAWTPRLGGSGRPLPAHPTSGRRPDGCAAFPSRGQRQPLEPGR